MSDKCKLICMAFDGDFVTEHPRGEYFFDSPTDAWEHASDMGSRWFFYPFWFVTTESGETIKDTPEDLQILKRVHTVANLFEKICTLPEARDADVDEFIGIIYSYLDN